MLTTGTEGVDHDVVREDVELLLVLSLNIGRSSSANPERTGEIQR